jgi:hypothetical protein
MAEIDWLPFYSIPDAGKSLADMSPWQVKQLLRERKLLAKKAGRRTLITGESLREYARSLPDARFLPPVPRPKRQASADSSE